MPRARDLQALIRRSSSAREYFLSLPVDMQMTLHRHGAAIRTAEELHRISAVIRDHAPYRS